MGQWRSRAPDTPSPEGTTLEMPLLSAAPAGLPGSAPTLEGSSGDTLGTDEEKEQRGEFFPKSAPVH